MLLTPSLPSHPQMLIPTISLLTKLHLNIYFQRAQPAYACLREEREENWEFHFKQDVCQLSIRQLKGDVEEVILCMSLELKGKVRD